MAKYVTRHSKTRRFSHSVDLHKTDLKLPNTEYFFVYAFFKLSVLTLNNMFLTHYWSYFHLFYLIRRFLRRFLPATFDMTENDSTGNSSLVVRSIVYIFFRAISRTTSTFWVISQENVFESSLAEPEKRIYHRWYTFHETNPADEKNNTVTGKHSLVYSNIARAKIENPNCRGMTPARQWLTVTVTLDSRTLAATALAHSRTHWHSLD